MVDSGYFFHDHFQYHYSRESRERRERESSSTTGSTTSTVVESSYKKINFDIDIWVRPGVW